MYAFIVLKWTYWHLRYEVCEHTNFVHHIYNPDITKNTSQPCHVLKAVWIYFQSKYDKFSCHLCHMVIFDSEKVFWQICWYSSVYKPRTGSFHKKWQFLVFDKPKNYYQMNDTKSLNELLKQFGMQILAKSRT